MRLIALLLLALMCNGQTRIKPSQVRWNQVDYSFWRQCFSFPGFPELYQVTYAYFPRQQVSPDGLTPAVFPVGTAIKVPQIANYGAAISADGLSVVVRTAYHQYTVTAANPMVSGTIGLRYAMSTPNFELNGLLLDDIAIDGGGWAKSSNIEQGSTFTKLPVITFTLTNGVFSNLVVTNPIRSTCDLWSDTAN